MKNYKKKIKKEYIGQTVKIYQKIVGFKDITIVDDPKKYDYYLSKGLKKIFEEPKSEPKKEEEEVKVISYKAIEPENTDNLEDAEATT